MNELAVFDPKAITDAIKGQIKSSIVGLIPDEQWAEMVEAEVRSFIAVDLPKLIKAEIQSQFTESLKLELAKPEYAGQWVYTGSVGSEVPGAAVKAILTELAPEMVQLLLGGVVQNAVNAMRNQMNSRNTY